ncbi:divalent-cation tolerance protein CutA [Chlamydia vaughanii]|uniref:divalent-cation tolerance protein CutA n=1 Tax=Chlamydia vaughanii TaxID=3112552 RepID=UPI0032B18F3B
MTPVIIFTQLSSHEEAELISMTLVKEKLAACVHVFPKGKSTYMWQGSLCVSEEYHMQIKTVFSQFTPVSNVIRSLCSYDVPEIVLVKIDMGDEEYLRWLSLESASETTQD